MAFYLRDSRGRRTVPADWWHLVSFLITGLTWTIAAVLGGYGLFIFGFEDGPGVEHAGIFGVVSGFGMAFTVLVLSLPGFFQRWRGTSKPLPERRPLSGIAYGFLLALIGLSLLVAAGSLVLFVVGLVL